jgi:cell wall-associated NlpC family hydrolase
VVPPRVVLTRPRKRSWAALVATIAAGLVLLPGSVAHAEPSVTEVEAQIAQVWTESEPLIEQYNEVHESYEQNLAKQAELAAQIQPLADRLSQAQERVGTISAEVYRGSSVGGFAAMLAGGTPGDLADRLSYLSVLSLSQQRDLHDVLALKQQYDAQKAPIDALVTELKAQDADLAQRKATIDARLDELQNLRRSTYAKTNGTGSLRPWPCPATYEPTDGYKAAAWACAQAGIPYVWAGASSSGYDCSGLTMSAWRQVGVYLPHNAAAQRRSMPYVDRANLQVGDLVFYHSDLHHVAIYVGDGKVMQAPQSGDVVRMTKMDYGSPIHSFGRPA